MSPRLPRPALTDILLLILLAIAIVAGAIAGSLLILGWHPTVGVGS